LPNQNTDKRHTVGFGRVNAIRMHQSFTFTLHARVGARDGYKSDFVFYVLYNSGVCVKYKIL